MLVQSLEGHDIAGASHEICHCCIPPEDSLIDKLSRAPAPCAAPECEIKLPLLSRVMWLRSIVQVRLLAHMSEDLACGLVGGRAGRFGDVPSSFCWGFKGEVDDLKGVVSPHGLRHGATSMKRFTAGEEGVMQGSDWCNCFFFQVLRVNAVL